MNTFDPSALVGLSASFDEDSELIEQELRPLRRSTRAHLRRQCASIKIASRLVAMVASDSASGAITDRQLIENIEVMMRRIGGLRRVALRRLNLREGDPDYAAAHNAVTLAYTDLVLDEWRYGKLKGNGGPAAIQPSELSSLLDVSLTNNITFLDAEFPDANLPMGRRLAILREIPRLYALVNYFDYFQPDISAFVGRLARAIAATAEVQASILSGDLEGGDAMRPLLLRTYRDSSALFCEVYKRVAAEDVERLRSMREDDRSIALLNYKVTGMPFGHVIDRFNVAADRAVDAATVIARLVEASDGKGGAYER